ncbi:MAG: asparagine synthase (glutamine-hydrolyzing) [Acidobacteria bacterium]|nr:asparagine synthase (glutamine-hydrolyzing) [Acidobacteriota bacterium]
MCGIVGLLTFDGPAEVFRGDVASAVHRMSRRGPDDAGLWSDDACCLLGFRRLSILDLSPAGHQPMLTRDGRYALVFNGELYNFREIRKELQDRGVTFRSTGDAEVVLYALAEFGDAALASFNGMFALAFYDTLTKRLLLARDHAAIKPLYVLRHRDGVLFASQYDQILAHPWARGGAVTSEGLALYAHLGYVPPPFALVAGTMALDAGAWLAVDHTGRCEEGRHFTFPRSPEPDLFGQAAYDAVDAAVTSAVRRQMVSDVPLGVFLSGGIDSPLVAAKMREATTMNFPAFTLGTNGDSLDESPDARRYAEALGLHHVVRQIVPADAIELLDEVVAASSEPHDDYSLFPTMLISRVAREQVAVVLSGDGGDDLFWGYPGRMIHPLAPASKLTMQGWRDLVRGAPATTSGPSAGAEQLRRQRFVDPVQLAEVFPDLPPFPRACTLFDFGGSGVDALALWLRWNEYSGHLGSVLQKVDRASMHHSLEVRVPLLDREVVDVAARIDWRSAVDLRRSVGKLPLRASLVRHAGFQTTTKRGFEAPMSAWLRGPLRPLFEDLVLSRGELLGLTIGQEALARIYRLHLTRVGDYTRLLWRLLSLALWEARHFRAAFAHAGNTAGELTVWTTR